MHRLFLYIFLMVSPYAFAQPYAGKLKFGMIPGAKDSVWWGTYKVYENRTTKSGRQIELGVIIVPAIHRESKLPPIFMLDGGPGLAASQGLEFYSLPFNLYRQQQDIVLVDMRGTGTSRPLHCLSLQYVKDFEDNFQDMYPPDAVKSCYDSLSAIADLTQYTTINIIQDIDEVRAWLGYDKISLLGSSYGTRAAQVYMKQFPSSLAGVVLWSPVSFGNRMPLFHARYAEDAMKEVFKRCNEDPFCGESFPDLRSEFSSLHKKWRKEPIVYNYTDRTGLSHRLHISWDVFQTKLRTLMYHPSGLRIVPYLIHQAAKGNLDPFLGLYPTGSSSDMRIAEGLYLCVTCTEDVPFIRAEEIAPLSEKTFMGTYRVDQQQLACSLWTKGTVPSNFLDPVVSDIPTLIIAGGLDPVTPVSESKTIAKSLKNVKVVVIPEMSHTFDGLSNEVCFDNLVIDFLRHLDPKKVKSECVSEMKPGPYKIKIP